MKRKLYKIILTIGLLGSFSIQAQKSVYQVRTKLSENVNSDKDESALMLSSDGKTLYFVRSFHPNNIGGESGNQDIWFSTTDGNGAWSKAAPLPEPVNNQWHNAVYGDTKDGKILYSSNIYDGNIYRPFPGISYSVKQGSDWGTPLTMPISFKFPKEGFFNAHVAMDGAVIVVSFQNSDSKGLEDLYILRKDANGAFSDLINVGETINTAGFETSPFLAPDGKTLYFSSNGHGGYGDGDIFKSTRLDETWTKWSKPENLGASVNSVGFDGSYVIDNVGNAYFISGDGADGSGDIYTTSTIMPPPPPPDTAGNYAKMMAQLRAEREKFLADSLAAANAKNLAGMDRFGVALFEFNSYTITNPSKQELKKVVAKLKKNANYKITVEGHTDDKGSESYNQKLSEKRARAVKNYLVKSGISAKKVESRGFGELNPIAENETDAGRSKNRRVEVKYYR